MKKVLIALALIFVLFIPTIEANNTAVLTRVESSSNNIKISLNQSSGFITSYNIKLKITGNAVSLKRVNWDSSIKSDYYKTYIYNASSNELEIYVVSKNGENLVNTNGVINIATLEIESKTNNNEYNIVLNTDKAENIVLMKNSYDKEIPSSTANNSGDKFIAKNGTDGGPSTNPSSNPSANPSAKPSSNPSVKPSASNRPSSGGNSSNGASSSASVSSSVSDGSASVSASTSDKTTSTSASNSSSSISYIDDKVDEEKNNEGPNFFLVLLFTILGVAVVVLVIYLINMYKNR